MRNKGSGVFDGGDLPGNPIITGGGGGVGSPGSGTGGNGTNSSTPSTGGNSVAATISNVAQVAQLVPGLNIPGSIIAAGAELYQGNYISAGVQIAGLIPFVADVKFAAKGAVGLDTNALIALLEGSPADSQAVMTAMAGRTPSVSITAAKEFLAGGGDVNALRSFLQSNGGSIGQAASAATRQALQDLGLKAADSRVTGSAIDQGINVITRDKQILNKVPGSAESF